MQGRIVRHRIVQAMIATAIAASLYTGWFWGDAAHYDKVDALLRAMVIG